MGPPVPVVGAFGETSVRTSASVGARCERAVRNTSPLLSLSLSPGGGGPRCACAHPLVLGCLTLLLSLSLSLSLPLHPAGLTVLGNARGSALQALREKKQQAAPQAAGNADICQANTFGFTFAAHSPHSDKFDTRRAYQNGTMDRPCFWSGMEEHRAGSVAIARASLYGARNAFCIPACRPPARDDPQVSE